MGSGHAQMQAAFNPPPHPHYNTTNPAHHHPHPHHHSHFGQLYQQQRPSFAIQEILGLGCRQHTSPSPVGADPGLMDSPGALPGTANHLGGALSGMGGNSIGGMPYFHGSHNGQHESSQPQGSYTPGHPHHAHPNTASSGGLYPWRFDLTPTSSPQSLPTTRFPGVVRHWEESGFGYKHNIADDGKLSLAVATCTSCG